jgi:hypothetical protein
VSPAEAVSSAEAVAAIQAVAPIQTVSPIHADLLRSEDVAEAVAVRATIVDAPRHREQGAAGSSQHRRVQRVSWELPHRDFPS